MGMMKDLAIKIIEAALKKIGKFDDTDAWAELSREFMEIGVEKFVAKYNVEY